MYFLFERLVVIEEIEINGFILLWVYLDALYLVTCGLDLFYLISAPFSLPGRAGCYKWYQSLGIRQPSGLGFWVHCVVSNFWRSQILGDIRD